MDSVKMSDRLNPQPVGESPHGCSLRRRQGFTVFFTGLSGAGKSCLAGVDLSGLSAAPSITERARPKEPSLHPGTLIIIPGVAITMVPESPLRSFRNAHHHAPELVRHGEDDEEVLVGQQFGLAIFEAVRASQGLALGRLPDFGTLYVGRWWLQESHCSKCGGTAEFDGAHHAPLPA
jgi:hypothetical protein